MQLQYRYTMMMSVTWQAALLLTGLPRGTNVHYTIDSNGGNATARRHPRGSALSVLARVRALFSFLCDSSL